MNEFQKTEQNLVKSKQNSAKKAPERSFFKIQWVYALAAIALGGYLIFQTVRSIDITNQKLDIFDLAKDEVKSLRLRNIDLILLSERVISEKYIESAARDRLNYAKDGETLFIVPSELLEDERLQEYVESFDPYYVHGAEQVDTYNEWEEFFRYGI